MYEDSAFITCYSIIFSWGNLVGSNLFPSVVEEDALEEITFCVGVQLADVVVLFPVGVVDGSVSDFNLISFPSSDSVLEDLIAFSGVGGISEVSVDQNII